MARNIIQKLVNSFHVRSVLIAFGLFILGQFVIYSTVPELETILLAVAVFITVSFLSSEFLLPAFTNNTYIFHFVLGALSYFSYILLLIFFKLTEESIKSELVNMIILGGLTVVASLFLDKYYEG